VFEASLRAVAIIEEGFQDACPGMMQQYGYAPGKPVIEVFWLPLLPLVASGDMRNHPHDVNHLARDTEKARRSSEK
jgi:hypothetical protein